MHQFFRVTEKLFNLLVKQEIDDDSKLALFETNLCKAGVKGRIRQNELKALQFSNLSSRQRVAILDQLCAHPLPYLPPPGAKQLELLYLHQVQTVL